MHKITRASKTSQTFWRNTESYLRAVSDSTETEFLLSFPIRFTMAIFAMLVKFTKASTSQLFQRKFFENEKNYGAKKKNKKQKCNLKGLLAEKLGNLVRKRR